MPGHVAARRPSRRHLAVDERGVGLRATWRREQTFVNISLWRDNVCVGTFHAGPAACADLIAVLARVLADAAIAEDFGEPGAASTSSGDERPAGAAPVSQESLRAHIARTLRATVARLERR